MHAHEIVYASVDKTEAVCVCGKHLRVKPRHGTFFESIASCFARHIREEHEKTRTAQEQTLDPEREDRYGVLLARLDRLKDSYEFRGGEDVNRENVVRDIHRVMWGHNDEDL